MEKNIKNQFENLSFNEQKHIYTVEGKILPSVSSLVKEFYEEFDSEKHSARVASKTSRTKEEVLKEQNDESERSRISGSFSHTFGENHVESNFNLQPSNNKEIGIANFQKTFYNEELYDVVALELRMYHPVYQYAGTCDILLQNKKNNWFELADYKTNKDLYKNFKGKKMKPPFEYLLDCPLSHYIIQQNLYKMILEEHGVEIGNMFLVHLNEQPYSNYTIHPLPDITKHLKQQYDTKLSFK